MNVLEKMAADRQLGKTRNETRKQFKLVEELKKRLEENEAKMTLFESRVENRLIRVEDGRGPTP